MSENSNKLKLKNFGLSLEEFNHLLRSLKSGDEDLFRKIFLSHGRDCIKLLQSKFGQSYEDAYDATMETLIQFRKSLIQGKLEYGNLRYIFNRMAKFYIIKKAQAKKEFSSEEMELFEGERTEEKYDLDKMQKLKQIWSRLSNEEKKILHLHYNLSMKLKDIAEKMGLTEWVVRKRKQRILEKMRALL